MLQNLSRREDQLEGDARLKLAVLAGQLVALREGLGNTLTSSRLCHVPVLVPTAQHACPVTHGKGNKADHDYPLTLTPTHCHRSIQL